MKKFLLFALCAIATSITYAQPYSKAKANTLKGQQRINYSYNTQISNESDSHHFYGSVLKAKSLKGSNLTKEQIKNYIEKFKNVKIQDDHYSLVYVLNGFIEQAIEFNKNKRMNLTVCYYIFKAYVAKREKEKVWEFGKYILIKDGQGITTVKLANRILHAMFRYKPESVTKQQQIEFLKQLSEIYPIPGTDFNQWKGFMGFVGFKYKALTKKDLF